MKRIIIICEGRTEFKFCKRVLAPHFSSKHIYIDPPKIKKSGGGIVKWPSLKKQIEKTKQRLEKINNDYKEAKKTITEQEKSIAGFTKAQE